MAPRNLPEIKFGGIYYFKYKENNDYDYKLILLYDYSGSQLRGYDLHYLFYMDLELCYSAYNVLNSYSGGEIHTPEQFIIDVLMSHPTLNISEKIKNIGSIKNKTILNTIEKLNTAHRNYNINNIIGEIKVLDYDVFIDRAKKAKGV